MLRLKRSTAQCALTARQNKINQKKEHYKSLLVDAFSIFSIVELYNNGRFKEKDQAAICI